MTETPGDMTDDRPGEPTWAEVPKARPAASPSSAVTLEMAGPLRPPFGPATLELARHTISRLRAVLEIVLLVPLGLLSGFGLSYLCASLKLPDPRWSHVAASTGIGLGCLAGCALLLRIDRHPWRSIGWTRERFWANVGIGLAGLALAYAVLVQAAAVITVLEPDLLVNKPAAHEAIESTFPRLPFWSTLLMMAFVTLWEETILRGFLLTRLQVLLRRWWLTIPVGAAVFGGLHAYEGTLAIVVVTGLGAVMGVLFVWRRSLVPTLTFHLVFNVVAFNALQWLSSTWE